MKLFLASLPFRAAWWLLKLPYRGVERVLAPPPKVIVLGEESRSGGFAEEPRGGFSQPSAPARPEPRGSAGFAREGSRCPRCAENDVYDGTCENCEWDSTCVKCAGCGDLTFSTDEGCCFECGHDGSVSTGFSPESTGSTGFAKEDSGRSGFAPEPKPERTFGATGGTGFRG
jgi:hypothetical protein